MTEIDTLKVVLLGNSGVGKTSIVERFVFDKFKAANPPTLGAMFVTRFVDIPGENNTAKLNIWDTAGQEKYHSMASTYYQEAAITLIVYDVTKKDTFEGAKSWLQEVQERLPQDTTVMLVGNKSDLVDKEEVDPKIATELAKNNNLKFSLVSAKDGMGIQDLFVNAVKDVMERRKNDKKKSDPSSQRKKLNAAESNKAKSGCC